MAEQSGVVEQARKALAGEPRIDLKHHPIEMSFADGTITLEGEVESVAAKKLALELVAGLPAVVGIVDRVRVRPAQVMTDEEIGRHLQDALLQEPGFADFAIAQGTGKNVPPEGEPRGRIWYEVKDGVVILNGHVPGLAYKRLAGVLAWWIPGSRDVVNGLEVVPEEEESEAELTDAVRLALEKDPFIDASQIRVFSHDFVVRLEGWVPREDQRHMAECDAWYVFGVDQVDNRIAVGD